MICLGVLRKDKRHGIRERVDVEGSMILSIMLYPRLELVCVFSVKGKTAQNTDHASGI
jgi:hypothetical protein